ncbi:MAG: helix-turn-helix domain-containing protein [Elusimicrobia bacterium]|nr:helix-turn-helix domain-containing protein [Elusimicrobiota bacterium]
MRGSRVSRSSRATVASLTSFGRRLPAAEELEPSTVIRSIRNALLMSQAQLAKRAGMPQSHLAKIETGKVDLQLGTLRRIFRAMSCEAVVLPRFLKPIRIVLEERIKAVARRNVARATGVSSGAGPGLEDNTLRDLVRSEEKRLARSRSSAIWDEPAMAGAGGEGALLRDAPVRLVDKEDDRETLRFWLAQPPEARISAVEFLRRQCYMVTGKTRLPRMERTIQLRERRA